MYHKYRLYRAATSEQNQDEESALSELVNLKRTDLILMFEVRTNRKRLI
jgi:hypothetical protein